MAEHTVYFVLVRTELITELHSLLIDLQLAIFGVNLPGDHLDRGGFFIVLRPLQKLFEI